MKHDTPSSLERRALLKASLAAAAGTVIAGAGALTPFAAARADSGKVLRVGYQKYGTLILLKARGTLEKRLAPLGVKVEWREFPAGPQLLEGLNAGAVDVGTVGETPPIFAQAGGVDFVYIGNEPPAPAAEAIVVPHDSPVKTVADLRSKRVALNRGSNVHFLLVRALEKAGLKYTDIQPNYLTPSDARAAFTQGSIDAWVIWDPYLAAIERQQNARVLTDGTGLVKNLQYYVATRSYASAQPAIVNALLDEIAALDAWSTQHLADVAGLLVGQTGLDGATIELAVKRTTFGVTRITEATLAYQQQIADTFNDLKLIPKPLTVADARWKA
ncbi:sulfonate ABC transporter substrate-binding protein [Trinickia terrae]|uniref:Putative aliphatic sulfonates-binding protein n=1 Tax=Trinickia terrae TaxID=2571161 RepID=A0A4V5PHI8_9BURK|nr:sulfonate ABC transporter substrate-binding protein [Trinickia terrae]TKC80380.1 sulfonate ABC transporter substrate-binding protein [Trinickia terrae]